MNRASRIHHPTPARNVSASRFYVFQLLTSPYQTFFTSQSPAQTIFPLQEKRTVISFRSYDVNLSGCLIFEPVPYLHHSTVTFLHLLGDYYGLRPKLLCGIRTYPYCLFFRIGEVELNDSSAMRTLYKLLGFQANHIQLEFFFAMRT